MSGIFPPDRFYSPITGAMIADTALELDLGSGGNIVLDDLYQQCCERRHMSTDDDLTVLVGASLLNVVIKNVDYEAETGDYVHQIMFVDVVTTKGTITLQSHNEHNGYYGGFDINLLITSSGGVTERYGFDENNECWFRQED